MESINTKSKRSKFEANIQQFFILKNKKSANSINQNTTKEQKFEFNIAQIQENHESEQRDSRKPPVFNEKWKFLFRWLKI